MKSVVYVDRHLESNEHKYKNLIKFTHRRKISNGGMRYYFSRIHIVDKSSVIDDYYIWSNDKEIKFLAIPMATTLSTELKTCAKAAIELLPGGEKPPTLNWNDQMLYVKITGEGSIPPLNKNLHIAVATYGILVSRENKAYLQFELAEWKIVDGESLLA